MTLAGLFTTKETGDSAERIAEQYLIERGLVLVARNYRCRFGEIDLIMQDGAALVFQVFELNLHCDESLS